MSHPALRAIEERRTTNLFDATRAINDAQIQELVRLATTAPTSFNLQNWRFIAVRTPEAKARLRKVAWDQAKVSEAAVTPGHANRAGPCRRCCSSCELVPCIPTF
jgi:nitroreductase